MVFPINSQTKYYNIRRALLSENDEYDLSLRPSLEIEYKRRICFSNGEVNRFPSCTIPDQAPSLKEMIELYVRGSDVTTFTPVYNGDTDMPDIERMTEIERIEYARSLKGRLNEAVILLNEKKPDPLPDPEPAPKPDPDPEPQPSPKK